jgi:hypothetical protein
LLSQLAEHDAGAAQRIAHRHILNFDKYDMDVSKFRKSRRELLHALSQKSGDD